MSDAGTAEGPENAMDEKDSLNINDLNDKDWSDMGKGLDTSYDLTPAEEIGNIGSDTGSITTTPNEPKPEPVSEKVTDLKKKAKRRSLLNVDPGNVYRRSIMGS